MGKRKFCEDKSGTFKKAKKDDAHDEQQNVDAINEQPDSHIAGKNEKNIPVNQHGFDVKHFRKELAVKQGQTMVLTQFLQVCLNPDNEKDYLLEYLQSGGNSHEILRQITQENKKNLSLATPAFHLFHLIILKVQASLPHMISVTEEACRYFLNTFMPTVEIMISENSGPRHRKIILKLLTSMVTLNPDLGVEVLNQAPLTPKHLQYILEKTNYKEKDNVRTAFVHFMTSFLVDGHLPLIKALLEKQGLLALVVPGLVQDEAEAVLMFLNILKKNVIDNSLISKSLKLKTFSHQVLHNLFKLFSWKGPPEISHEGRNNARPDIMELLSEILLILFTSHRLGLYFLDPSLGTADANKNQNLYKALLTLKRPWENEFESETILQIIFLCPDLHRAIINVIEQSFEPQHSPIWERATQFVINLLDKLKPEAMVARMKNLSSIQTANFVRFITLPVPLLKFINANLAKDHTISVYCIKVLVKMLQTLKRYMQIIEIDDSQHIVDLKNRLEYFVPKHLPTPSAIVALVKDVMDGKGKATEASQDYILPEIKEADALISLIDLLLLYNDVHPAFFETLEGNIDMKKLLDYSTRISEASVLKFKVVSLWLTLDSNAIALTNPIFKDLFLILLEIYNDDCDGNTRIEAKDTLFKFFKNTSIFESDDNEIHLLLFSLLNSQQRAPAELIFAIVEYVLENVQELTDFVRNQLINSKLSDESSSSNLQKLFGELMENKTSSDTIYIENKEPSPFIVGSMQYLKKHKDKRKDLEHFLALYIVNLLHSNCSPELIQALIGETELGILKYLEKWESQPKLFPFKHNEATNQIHRFSKIILDNVDYELETIIPCLEKVPAEESDFTLNNVSYKVKMYDNINDTNILIWANYLISIMVTLTKTKQLNDKQAEIIFVCFESLLQVGKNYHMVDTCRTIIPSLFKNAHVLKIYTALNTGKNCSNVLATHILLKTIENNENIINYLDRKHKLLKSYQQKNYTEIMKLVSKNKKKKDADTDHTTKVLTILGMSKEDDLRVLNEIFNADVAALVKEDKEPSIVLEILRIMMEKYAKSIALEPQPGVLKKALKLYTDLLTNKEVSANLTNIENSLILFLENKPHHIGAAVDDTFKKFFSANTVRKSTSKLAATILKLNAKLCTIYKDELSRPDILGQRELALPLGNAILNHKQFVNENRELLSLVFDEYKSNIVKFLEKPHKAGQIYITSWEFIRKLVLECMPIDECEKIFSKIHKYETFEPCHVRLLHAVFLKMIVSQVQKKDNFVHYFSMMLNLVSLALKEMKDFDTVHEVLEYIHTVTILSNEVCSEKEYFKKLTESATWQNFCKAVLKDSLKVRTAHQGKSCGPRLLCLLTRLVSLFYPDDHEDIGTLFDMVTSHSEFLNVMLSHHSSDIKSRLVEFIYVLIEKNKSLMKTQQIPVYLSAYHATRSPCDRMLLTILQHYESNGLPVNDYKPYVFGDSAANHYAVRKNRTSSLWAHPTPNQVLNLFEKYVIERTVRNFPVTQKLEYVYKLPYNIEDGNEFIFTRMSKDGLFKARQTKDNEGAIANLLLKLKYEEALTDLKTRDIIGVSHAGCEEEVYDPVFVFSLLSHLLAPGSVASCFKLLRSGLLALPVVALASLCPLMRAAAYHVLHRFCQLLETETRHKNDKLFLTDFIETLRQSLVTAIVANEESLEDLQSPRLPAVDALYLAKALMVSTAPSDPLYKPVNNFFIAKQVVDLTVVPDFLSLFHDSDVEAVERRAWILDIIKHGTKSMTDVNVIFKTMCLKMIMDFNNSVLCDRKTNEKIVSVLSAIVSIPRACEILIEGYGLMSWLHSFVRQLKKEDRATIKSVLGLFDNVLRSVTLNAFNKNLNSVGRNGKPIEFMELKLNKDVENEILIMLYSLINHIDLLEEDDVSLYVNIYTHLSKKVVKSLSRKQMLNLVDKIGENKKDNEDVKLLKKALVKSEASILRSASLQSTDGVIGTLTGLVRIYLCN